MIGYELEVFVHIKNDQIWVGVSICNYSEKIKHRDAVLSKRNRTECSKTTLNSAIAYCMCRAAKIKPGDLVIDPMAGSGMIPIEGGLMYPNALFIAGDIAQNELKIAKINIDDHANYGNVMIIQWNIKNLPLKDRSVDSIVSDLPFGHRHLNFTKNQALYPKMMRELARVAKPGSRGVFLTMEKGLVRRFLRDEKGWTLISSFPVDVGGFEAELYILQSE